MFLATRGRPGYDRWLRLRLALFVIGTGFVLAGMRAERRWAVWLGIGVLLVAVVIRFLSRRRAEDEPPEGED
jgi:hypothetical protein